MAAFLFLNDSMKIQIPSNIFTAIFALNLPDKYRQSVETRPSSVIVKEIEEGKAEAGLIPSLDLINHKELLVSKKIAVSFDGDLSNSYLYFKPNQNSFDTIKLQGDVTTNEVILSKILFRERFNSDVKIVLDTEEVNFENQNYLLCGNINLEKEYFDKGISFSDQIAEMINYPYTQYLLASRDENLIAKLNDDLKDLDKIIEDNLEENLSKIRFGKKVDDFLKREFNSVYYEMTQNEVDGFSDLLRQPYYHTMIEEIFEIKFV